MIRCKREKHTPPSRVCVCLFTLKVTVDAANKSFTIHVTSSRRKFSFCKGIFNVQKAPAEKVYYIYKVCAQECITCLSLSLCSRRRKQVFLATALPARLENLVPHTPFKFSLRAVLLCERCVYYRNFGFYCIASRLGKTGAAANGG